jgi:membrane associated rhomboid family serine protease
MFPLRDENPHFLTPWMTWTILGANLLTWFFLEGAGMPDAVERAVCSLGLVPGSLLTTDYVSSPMCGHSPNLSSWATVLTSMFLHGSWFHLIGNMWFFWVFGNNVEDSMGHFRFLIFYILCGAAAAAAQMFSNPGSDIPMVGASGAIGGVMGAYIILYPRVRVVTLLVLGIFIRMIKVSARFMLGYWFFIQVLSGTLSTALPQQGGTAFWAHVGGFAAGVILIFLFRDKDLVNRHPIHGWRRA